MSRRIAALTLWLSTRPLSTIERPSMMIEPRSVICPNTGSIAGICSAQAAGLRLESTVKTGRPGGQLSSRRAVGPGAGWRLCRTQWGVSRGGSACPARNAHEMWLGSGRSRQPVMADGAESRGRQGGREPQPLLQEPLHASSRTSRVKIIGRRSGPIMLGRVTPRRIYGLRRSGGGAGLSRRIDRCSVPGCSIPLVRRGVICYSSPHLPTHVLSIDCLPRSDLWPASSGR